MSTPTELAEHLKKAGYKLTPARLAVVEVLETYHNHLSHVEILEKGKKIYPKLSRATVYRTMDILVALQLVRPLYLNEPTQRFISAAGGHHHLVCSKCGDTFEFDYCTANQISTQLEKQYNFQIHSHLLEFKGLCGECH